MFQSDIFNASGILFSAVTLLKQHLRDRKSLKLSAENLDGGMGKKKKSNEWISFRVKAETYGWQLCKLCKHHSFYIINSWNGVWITFSNPSARVNIVNVPFCNPQIRWNFILPYVQFLMLCFGNTVTLFGFGHDRVLAWPASLCTNTQHILIP